MEKAMTLIGERQRARFYKYKKQKNCETFVYIYTKKLDTLQNQDNLCYLSIHKKLDTLRYAILMKFLKLGFIYIQKA